jgi:ribonuclease D
VLREITAVREAFAIKSNVPRARMLKDESLLEIAATCPKTTEELAQTRGVHEGQAKSPFGQELLAAVKKALALPKEEYPQEAFQKHTSPSGQGAVVDMLRLLLKIKCEQEGVAQKLVANSADLEELARADSPKTPVLQGWRYDLFGKHAMDLKEGRLAFTLKDRKIQLVEVK